MMSFAKDARQAFRKLLRTPGFTVAAVVTLALGIGGATAIYTVVHGVILDPLPYPEADRLVRVKSPVPGSGEAEIWNVSTAQFFHLREHASTIAQLGAFDRFGGNVRGADEAERVSVARTTAGLLDLIGARAGLGRMYGELDDRPGALPVVVLSHGFWQRGFGGDPGVLGTTVEINEFPFEVIGVMAAGARLPGEPGAPASLEQSDVWIPFRLDPSGPFMNSHSMIVIGRLADGVGLDGAQQEVSRLNGTLSEAFPAVYSTEFMERFGFQTQLVPLKEYVVGDTARFLWILFGGVALVLLISAANMTNLYLTRMEGRRRELAVRSALGAGRGAIARLVFAESMVLALAGGALALIAGFWAVHWLVAGAPDNLPRLDNIGLGAPVILFSCGVSVLIGAGLGALALFRYGREGETGGIGRVVRTGSASSGQQGMRSGLVATQMALALVLVVAAGLLIETFEKLRAVDPGIDPDQSMSLRVHLPPGRYRTLEEVWRFQSSLLDRIDGMPQAVSAGFGGTVPLSGEYPCVVHGFEDAAVLEHLRTSEGTTCPRLVPTSPGYFEALGIPLLAGRGLTRADHDRPEVGAVVVSRAFAERFWPGEDPIGQGVRPFGAGPPPFYRVVGVVGDVPAGSIEEPPAIAIYYPIVPVPGEAGWWHRSFHLVVRTGHADPTVLLPAIRATVRELDPAVPIAQVETMREIVNASTSRVAFTMVLLGMAAAIALLLAGVGLYGVISYLVARRTVEIGIRSALGARPAQVVRLVVAGSARMVALGVVSGTAAALLLTRIMRDVLFGVEPSSPLSYATAIITLSLVAIVASYLPARRAALVDPAVALKNH